MQLSVASVELQKKPDPKVYSYCDALESDSLYLWGLLNGAQINMPFALSGDTLTNSLLLPRDESELCKETTRIEWHGL